MHRTRKTVLTAAAIAAALALSACGGGGSDSGGTSGGAAAGAADPNATLNLAHSVLITSMDPHATSNVYDYPYQFFAYDRLTYIDKDGKAQPMLAESWEVGDGGKSLTLKLKQGLKFTDGDVFDADAVVKNFERMRTLPTSAVKAQIASVTGEEKVDANTVKLVLSDASAGALPNILGGFAGAMVSPSAMGDPQKLAKLGSGLGPYKVVENRGADGVMFEKVPGYWDPSAQKVAKIKFSSTPDDTTRLNSIQTGAANGGLIRAPQVEQAKAAGLTLVQNYSASPTMFELNMSRAQLDNKEFRKAIWYGLNAKEISDGAYGGACLPNQQIFGTTSWAYDEGATEPYPYDLAKAKAALAASGLQNPEVTMVTNPVPTYTTTSQIIQAQLAKVGIKVNIKTVSAPETTIQYWVKKQVDANITVDAFVLDPSKVIDTFYSATGFRNVSAYKNAQIDQLAAQAKSIEDQGQRAELYHQIQKIIWDEALNPVVLCYQQQTWAFDKKTSGMEFGATGIWDFRHMQVGK